MAWGWWVVLWGFVWFVLYDTIMPYKLPSALLSVVLTPVLGITSMVFCAAYNIQ